MINCFIFSFFSSSEKLKFEPDPDFINRLIPFSRDSRHASIQFSSIIISYCRSKSFESITTKKRLWNYMHYFNQWHSLVYIRPALKISTFEIFSSCSRDSPHRKNPREKASREQPAVQKNHPLSFFRRLPRNDFGYEAREPVKGSCSKRTLIH